ncbi:hypothetical protein SASPL_109920 [Salvia splendens]|uniref:PGR5-like protein 1A, chloroplastic n=1 Tax=Salvia splendens TaxID=180675 RepID=A0A8X8YF57_SALSN|nr:hypothetical protein SASPL_109920 [Salvia splendens]
MASRLGFNLSKPNLFTARIRKPFFSASSLPSPAPVVHTLQFASKKLTFQRRLLCISPQATSEQPGQVQEDEVVDSNAFYYEGKSIMSNEEFDNLKEELMWEGSSVVMLSADEQRFLEASMAYVSGNPILLMGVKSWSRGLDAVYVAKRFAALLLPCIYEDQAFHVYSDLSVDYLKMFLLNVPAAVVALVLFFFLDDLTGFEITYLLEIPEPFSFIFTWFTALPLILWLSFTFTNFIVKDFLILVGPCPNCGTENTSFFGTILSISSGGATNKVKCSNCGTDMVYDSKSRLITLPEGSEA